MPEALPTPGPLTGSATSTHPNEIGSGSLNVIVIPDMIGSLDGIGSHNVIGRGSVNGLSRVNFIGSLDGIGNVAT
jgi:hypothetical protein